MSIKGTLETFNLCELLQMLAFNQKQGTLVLEGEFGARTLFLDQGGLSFLEQDAGISASLERLTRYYQLAEDDALASALEAQIDSGRNLGSVLESMGLLDSDRAQVLHREAIVEQLFECQLTAVAGFEFVEGKALHADGSEGRPIQPLLPVESLLLDLARMLDHWNTIIAVIPGISEIYEGTGIAVDLAEHEDIDPELASAVIPLLDGRRSLEQIGTLTYATHFGVMQIASALFEGGGIRAVPTDDLVRRGEDMLARGEAAATVAIFQRCLDRGDVAIDVRLRLADALEASGDPAGAAAELDTFAALKDDEDAPTVFEALSRALRLRGGDLATAARVCDYYLRRRPWLQDYRTEAAQALRDLITAATTEGRPTDAALRLQGFIECGDAPSEDGVLLADLYAAGGARAEAAEALHRRAEDLIATDRTAPARQLLRRALELDPGHADARRRKAELEGVRKRRGHRARIALILLALGGVASAAGVAWFGYQDTASTELVGGRAEASNAVAQAEIRSRAAVDAFKVRVEAVAREGLLDEGLAQAAAALRAEVKDTMATTLPALETYAAAIDEGQATGHSQRHKDELGRLQQRGIVLSKHAARAIRTAADLAGRALADAKVHHGKGEFLQAAMRLRVAVSLSFEDTTTHAGATRRLKGVMAYIARFEELRERMEALTARGELQAAFRAGLDRLTGEDALYDSDLTRTLAFPVKIDSSPQGAEVWLGTKDTTLRTPCVLTYSPFLPKKKDGKAPVEDTTILRLRMPGRVPSITHLPKFTQMRREPQALHGYLPSVNAELPPGPRWTIADPSGHFHVLWRGKGLPLVAGDRGHLVYSVAPRDGELTATGARVSRELDGIRLAGRIGDLAWHVTGHRTLTVRSGAAKEWDLITEGRIERAPIRVGGLLIIVDELGTLYARKEHDGAKEWDVDLDAPPSQRPYASSLGVLSATTAGATYRIDPKTGAFKTLAPAAHGAALAVPFGDKALVLGGGAGGCRVVSADGSVRVLADAQPNIARQPWVIPQGGVAWIEVSGGVRWLPKAGQQPLPVPGLGAHVDRLGGDAETLYGAGTDGRMRAVRLAELTKTLWSSPLGGRAQNPPIRLDGGLYVLVDGRLVAFDH